MQGAAGLVGDEGPETVAAFLAEPVQGAGGLMVPQDDYFPRIREICNKYDVLFMADEVITGFGRLGRWFGLEHWNVEPDIISFAKGITSGYLPLGGIGMSDRVYQVLNDAPPNRRWMHAFTYSGHPTCCAVALVTLDILEREGLIEEAGRKGKKLLAGLKQLATLEGVGDVRGLGLMWAIEFGEPTTGRISWRMIERMQPGLFAQLVVAPLFSEHRILSQVAAHKLAVIKVLPPLVVSGEDLDYFVDCLRTTVRRAQRMPSSLTRFALTAAGIR